MITVLLADDNTQLCDTLKDHINQQEDMEVVGIVSDGEQTLEALKRRCPDVLLLDVTMPRLDGLGVLERLHTEDSGKPCVVVLTALGRDDVAQRLTQLGARYLMVKPFDPDLLIERIRESVASERYDPLLTMRRQRADSSVFEHENRVTSLLHEMGVPPNLKGYGYLREAVLTAISHPRLLHGGLTTELYPSIARKYRTTPTGVEAAIRHSIRVAWNNNRSFLAKITGTAGVPRKTLPPNSLVISRLVDVVLDSQ
ncbi:MAG: sporulation transcription factor Spo0A [Limnochordia bacterium]|jgi:two-component system response regulator (stage 0 sporulation protein A)